MLKLLYSCVPFFTLFLTVTKSIYLGYHLFSVLFVSVHLVHRVGPAFSPH